MYREIIWLILNLIIMVVSALYNNFFLALVSYLSIPFLYYNFLDSIKDYMNKRITLKIVLKEYSKFLTFTSATNRIYSKLFLGTYLTVKVLMKFEYLGIYPTIGYSIFIFGMITMMISLFKNVINFNN